MRKKFDAYMMARPKLLLTLVWVFLFAALIPAIYITITNPTMGFFPFAGRIIIQAAIALYLRLLYGNIQRERKEQRKAEREAQREAANQARHHHKKRK